MKRYADLREYIKAQKYRIKSRYGNKVLPGGLGAAKLVTYAHNNYGVEITLEEAKLLKALWLDSFPEMREHLQPKQDQEFSDEDEQWYIAQTINGRISRRASYNAACNYPLVA